MSIDTSGGLSAAALGAAWHARAAAAQDAALPRGSVAVSCPAPLGAVGLGRHLRELLDALERAQQQPHCLCEPGESERVRTGGLRSAAWKTLFAAGRFSPAWRLWVHSVRFDHDRAGQLPRADHLLAFNGAGLSQLRAASRHGYESLSVVSATVHFRRLVRQQERACRAYPLERPWARLLLRRNLNEYASADRVYVSCNYIRDSFIEEGFPPEALSLFPLTPDPRFTPGLRSREQSAFEIVYVGGLTVDKGVPVLLEAVRRLGQSDLQIALVGGWKSRAMRRYIQRACAEDPRVRVCPGDPLSYLRGASLYVHPAYSDGFGYAPAEALACGIPVIASEDTGMKELIAPGRNGLIVPTGDVGALAEAIDAAYRGAAFGE